MKKTKTQRQFAENKTSKILGKTQGLWVKLHDWGKLKGLGYKTQRTGSRSLHLVTQKVVKNTACFIISQENP